MPRLSPVPDSPPRAVGLIRVSKEREEMISPEIQRTAIEDHCQRRGYVIIEWIEGIDESGSRARSKWWARLDDAAARITAGDADVLVVWRFSRTARHRLRWAIAIDKVEVAGGRLESATEPLDTSTPSGRLARGMLAEFAAYEAEAIGATWREVHARRLARGLPINGKQRFGYTVLEGRFVPDPKTGPILADLYRRFVAGETVYALVAWLNTEGIWTVPGYSARGGGPWSQNSLRNMLDRGFAAGLIQVGGEFRPGAQEPIITEATWTAYRAARAARRWQGRTQRSRYTLSGLVWCVCGSKMGMGDHASTGPRLRCLASTEPGAERHKGAYVLMPPVQAAVREWVTRLGAEMDAPADVLLVAQSNRARAEVDVDALRKEISNLDSAIGRLAANHAQFTSRTVELGIDNLEQQQAQLEQRLLTAETTVRYDEAVRLAADLAERWDLYSAEKRRVLLGRLISRVVAKWAGPGRVDVEVVPTFAR